MSKTLMKEKFMGCIAGAAIGDSLGAATEMLSKNQIKDTFGGYVKGFEKAPKGVLASDRTPGNITDDFSMAYHIMLEIINNEGIMDDNVALRSLINWYEDENEYTKYGGPTTLGTISKLKNGENARYVDPRGLGGYNHFATNGCAMKIFPIGLMYGKNEEILLDMVKTTIVSTHYTDIALSGACAIAFAVAEAINPKATIDSIIEEGVQGAELGYQSADDRFHKIAGASISKRIRLAVDIASKCDSFDEVVDQISDIIGTGVAIVESVPATFGFISFYSKETMNAIYCGVNCGHDTDTIASMAGAILGAFNGLKSLNKNDIELVSKVTNINFEKLSEELLNVYQ